MTNERTLMAEAREFIITLRVSYDEPVPTTLMQERARVLNSILDMTSGYTFPSNVEPTELGTD